MSCIFCEISRNDSKNQVIKRYSSNELLYNTEVVVFEPLNPCVEGHLLFVPTVHIDKFGEIKSIAPNIVAAVNKAVSLYLQEFPMDCNIITNNGAIADQTVFHTHTHLIPRTENDNVQLPWSYQHKA